MPMLCGYRRQCPASQKILALSIGADRDAGEQKLRNHASPPLAQGASAGRSTRDQAGPAIVRAILHPSLARDATSAGRLIRPNRFPAEGRKRYQLNFASIRDIHPGQLRSVLCPVLQCRRRHSIEVDLRLPDTLPSREDHALGTCSAVPCPAFGVQEDITGRPRGAPDARCIQHHAHTGCMPAAVSSRVHHQNAAGCRRDRSNDRETPSGSVLLLQPCTPVPTGSA